MNLEFCLWTLTFLCTEADSGRVTNFTISYDSDSDPCSHTCYPSRFFSAEQVEVESFHTRPPSCLKEGGSPMRFQRQPIPISVLFDLGLGLVWTWDLNFGLSIINDKD